MHKGLLAVGVALAILALAPPGQAEERTVLYEMFTNTS